MLSELLAAEFEFTPHSLRHGGATNDLILNLRTLEQIVERGRWQQSKSARTYLQAARSLVLQFSVHERVRVKGMYLQQNPEAIVKDIL